jgi:glutathione synthase/RimK-type ligase-like ATP-grasp enzyme
VGERCRVSGEFPQILNIYAFKMNDSVYIEILVGAAETANPYDENATIINMVTDYHKDAILKNLMRVLRAMYNVVRLRQCTLFDYTVIIQNIVDDNRNTEYVVFQLCDGTEIDGYPGISVVRELERRKIKHTGASSYFYDITTSKSVMKRAFLQYGVSTSPFIDVYNDESINLAEQMMNYPMIIKPAISYASIGISRDSILYNRCDAAQKIARRIAHINGEGQSEYIIERFLDGREFTVLVIGSGESCVAYAAERAFDRHLHVYERMLSFDAYWANELTAAAAHAARESCVSDSGACAATGSVRAHEAPTLCVYSIISDTELESRVCDLAMRAYQAVRGTGYGRVDIRSDAAGTLYVLEVNAQPSFSINDEETSMSNILKIKDINIYTFMQAIIKI